MVGDAGRGQVRLGAASTFTSTFYSSHINMAW